MNRKQQSSRSKSARRNTTSKRYLKNKSSKKTLLPFQKKIQSFLTTILSMEPSLFPINLEEKSFLSQCP